MGLIGPACTPRKGFSGRVLIGRGLTQPNTRVPKRTTGTSHRGGRQAPSATPPPAPPAAPRRPQGLASTSRFTGPQPHHHPGSETGPGGLLWGTGDVAAAMAVGKRPDPFRTRKLSPPAPRVLPGRPGGRAGHRRTTRKKWGRFR